MKQFAKIIVLFAGLLVLLFGGAYALIESGEVVVLRTDPGDDHRFLARLWVVDYEGQPWISTTDPSKTDWVPWLRAHPRVEVERDGRPSCREVVFGDDPEAVRQLNALLHRKYRIESYGSSFLKRVSGAARGDERRVWIRLEPCVPSR